MRITNLLSDLLKTDLAGITPLSENNWWQFFLHIVLRCLANHKNGKFADILKCILWGFDKKSGYFLFLLSIVILYFLAPLVLSLIRICHMLPF